MCACESDRNAIKEKINNLLCDEEKIKYYLDFTIEKELKSYQDCQDKWSECLKKREERKNQVQKEMNSAFIPCFVKEKADEFHDCLKCYRRTKACVLHKKQNLFLTGITKKLVEKQLALVKGDVKQAEIFLETFDKIQKKKSTSADFLEKTKLPEKANKLVDHIDAVEFDEEQELKDLSKTIKNLMKDSNLSEADKKNLEIFIQAKKRIHEDFCIDEKLNSCNKNLVLLAIERCGLLRDYDRQGSELLTCLNLKNSSNNNLEESKLTFDSIFNEYEELVKTAQKKYDMAIANFSQIAKSPKLNCTQRRCISLASENNSEKCRQRALKEEEKYIGCWEKNNNHRTDLQKNIIKRDGETQCTDSTDLKDQKDCMKEQCISINNYEKLPSLDSLEASIPEYLWENIIKYEEARYLLSEIASLLEECKKKTKQELVNCALSAWVNAFLGKDGNTNNHYDQLMLHAHDLLKEQTGYAEKNKTERIQITTRGDANFFIAQDFYIVFQDIMERISEVEEQSSENIPTGRCPHSYNPYNLCTKKKDLLKCSSITKLPSPCSPCTLPCKDKGKKKSCCDDATVPCIEDPQCDSIERERATADTAKQHTCHNTTPPTTGSLCESDC